MPITKADLDNAKQDDDKRKADANQAKLKTKEKESNEAPRKAASDAVTAIRDKLNFKRGGTVKTKRYAVGGEADDTAKSEVFKNFKSGESKYERDDNEVSSSPSSFKEAFAEARRRGDKTFMWNGERKTTELASSKPKPAPKAETKASPYEDTKADVGSQSFESPKKEGRGLTPYEKTQSIKGWAKMMSDSNRDRDTAPKKSDDEKTAETRRRAAGKFQKSNEAVYGMKKGGSVKSASARADGCAIRGKTRA